jgi:hypothetical protein
MRTIGRALALLALGLGFAVAADTPAHAAISGIQFMNASSVWSPMCLDVPHNPPPNGDLIHTWQCLDISDQSWTYTGSIHGLLVAQGKCLDVPNSNYNYGVQLIVWDCHGNMNQQWAVGERADGSWLIQSWGALNQSKSLCVDIGYSPPWYDTAVTLGPCDDRPDVLWYRLYSV